MRSEKTLIWRMVSLGTLVFVAKLAAAQMPSPALLVVNKDDSTLAIVDPLARKVVGSVPTGDGPHEVSASDDGKLAFVTNYGARNAAIPGSSVSVIDLAAQKELRRVEIGPQSRPHGIFYADGKVYFPAEGFKLVGRFDPASNQIDWMLGTGQNRTHALVLNKDLDRIFTANMGSDSVTAMERLSDPV